MRASLLSSVVALCLLANCTHTQALVITGNTLQAAGEQFLVVAAVMEELATEGKLTEEQYARWAEFGTKFQRVYPAAVHLWKVAVLNRDAALERQAEAILMTLLPELLMFAQELGVTLEVLKL